MTTDEIKALIAQTIQGQGDAVDVGGGLAKILNGILDAIPESGVMPEPKYDVPTNVRSGIDPGQFAESIGISVDELPDFFRAQAIKWGNLHLTRTYYAHFTENEEEYRAVFGDLAADYGLKVAFSYNITNQNILVDYTEV